ncbi:methylated-DNA--protein-cysteine methyltransferase [Pedobacter glucosidilyticus]|nr:methylated-DNA--[protein]-cysteine S-methyltransferase [Pedobacter glucosidilyticus]KHJ37378.1 methylated-DNA--protein-cysteine methyltransferase [Pedobacter glucosidilyticus]
MNVQSMESPLGFVIIKEEDQAICEISFADVPEENGTKTDVLTLALTELQQYLDGDLKSFTFPIKQSGTDFQQQVWSTLQELNFAEVISYTTLAIRMQNLLAIRAIAAANGKNKIMIAVPCHRVVGMAGELTGYAGGVWRKQWLLEHEAKIAGIGQTKLF